MFETGPTELKRRARSSITALQGEGRGWALLGVASGWLLALGVRYVFPALVPQLKDAFGLDNTGTGFVITLIWLTYALMQFPAGLLVNQFGERRIILWSLLGTALGIALIVSTTLYPVFLLGCIVVGLGTGLYGPPRVTLLSRLYPDRDGVALGITFASGSLGSSLLPAVASVVVVSLSWQYGFGFVIVLLAVTLAFLWRVIPALPPQAAATDGGFRALLRDTVSSVTARPVWLAGVAITLMVFTYQGILSFLPLYLITTKSLSQPVTATLYGGMFIVGAVFQPVAGWAGDRYGNRRMLVVISGVSVLIVATLPFVQGLLPVALVVGLIGLRLGTGPINSSYLMSVLPDERQGPGYGLLRSVYVVLGSFGSLVVGALFDARLLDESYFLMAGLTGAALVCYWFLPRDV